MNRLKYIIVSLVLCILVSCDSFLDRTPISNANENDFYKSEKDFKTALSAAYSTLHTLYGPESMPSFFGELMSDNAYSDNSAGSVKDVKAFETHIGMEASNGTVLDFWNKYYESIFILNNIIAKSAALDFNDKPAVISEAYFLRALLYFDMTRAWGDIPLVLAPMSITESLRQGRTEQSKVYEAIVDDLLYAAENLPLKSNERFSGAASSEAAYTLLGKVYLTMGNKEEAAKTLLKVYGKFSLVPYEDLWDLKKKNGAESIFEIQYKGGKANPFSYYWAMFTPVDNRIVTVWGGGFNQVSEDLWNAYETGDIRRELSIQNGYATANGNIVDVKFSIKWKDENAEVKGLHEASDNNFILLRYADVLLMLTEATGNTTYLNEVRDRVSLPRYGTAGYPAEYSTPELATEHERQVEFALEFHRWFDLIRTGRAIEVLKNSRKNVTIPPGELLLPIPLEVITQNPNVMTQNPAYIK